MQKGPPSQPHLLNISDFKARCLRLLDETRQKGKEYTIMKKGVPIARVVPIQKRGTTKRRGSLKGLAEIRGDIIHCETSDDWEVLKTS